MIRILFLFFIANQALGVVSDSPDKLNFVVLKVNGEARKVSAGDELFIVRGDTVVITDATLMDPAKKVSAINLIGYQSSRALVSGEDRGYPIRTERDLIKYWSVEKEGKKYRIKVMREGKIVGDVFLSLIEPTLDYAELKINGETTMAREGQLLRVKGFDKFKVVDVKTNVNEDRKNVEFQLVPVNPEMELKGVKVYELRFLRLGKVFATIPMQVENL